MRPHSAPTDLCEYLEPRLYKDFVPTGLRRGITQRIQVKLEAMFAKTTASLLLPFAFLLLPSLSVLSQGGTKGRIAGTVKDAKGALIAGAEITVASRATGEERTVIADATGDYAVLLLPPGHYRVSIKASGFKQAL